MKTSCLNELYSSEAKKTIINDCEVVLQYTSADKEYDVLRNDVAIIDGFGYEMFTVTGDGAEDFLNAHLTKDIVFLNYGSIVECMILNENAEILSFAFVYKYEDHFLVLVPPEKKEEIFSYFRETAEDDIEISILDRQLCFLEGPKSWKMVRDVLNVEIDTVALRTYTETEYKAQKVSIARIGRSGEYGYALISDENTIKSIVLDCLNNPYELKCDFCGLEMLYLCMLEIHQPNIRYEDSSKWNLFELGYQWFIQYDKEEYVGKEKTMELFENKWERNAVGFISDTNCEEVEENATIWLEDECVGTVMYYIFHPLKRCIIGMAMLDKKVAVSGIALTIKKDDSDCTIETLSSPYVRPVSWDEKIEY